MTQENNLKPTKPEPAKVIPLEKLLSRKETVEFEIDGTKIIWDIVKPNLATTERITRAAELAKAQAKINEDYIKVSKVEAETLPIDQIIEVLSLVESSATNLKLLESLKEKYKEFDKMVEIANSNSAEKELKEKATRYIDKYYEEYNKKAQEHLETKKKELKVLQEEEIRKRAFQEFLETRAFNDALNMSRRMLVKECVYYPNSNTQVFSSLEEVTNLDDQVFEAIYFEVEKVANLRGIDIKKVSSKEE